MTCFTNIVFELVLERVCIWHALQIAQLESEKKFLQNVLETNKAQYEEEIKIIKENHVLEN